MSRRLLEVAVLVGLLCGLPFCGGADAGSAGVGGVGDDGECLVEACGGVCGGYAW